MKLLNCHECQDIVQMRLDRLRSCLCGKSTGKYVDNTWVKYSGPARIIGMLNSEYWESKKAPVVPFVTNYKWFPILEGDNCLLVEQSEILINTL